LRLETVAECDKKKSELYFDRTVKKILTENVSGHACLREKNRARATLTVLTESRMIFRLREQKLEFGSAPT
jgi:hypothetical protein